MGRIFGVLLIVGSIWVGLELYQNGRSGAFGGAFASILGVDPAVAEEPATPGRRAGSSVERAHRESEQRYERMLGD